MKANRNQFNEKIDQQTMQKAGELLDVLVPRHIRRSTWEKLRVPVGDRTQVRITNHIRSEIKASIVADLLTILKEEVTLMQRSCLGVSWWANTWDSTWQMEDAFMNSIKASIDPNDATKINVTIATNMFPTIPTNNDDATGGKINL